MLFFQCLLDWLLPPVCLCKCEVLPFCSCFSLLGCCVEMNACCVEMNACLGAAVLMLLVVITVAGSEECPLNSPAVIRFNVLNHSMP